MPISAGGPGNPIVPLTTSGIASIALSSEHFHAATSHAGMLESRTISPPHPATTSVRSLSFCLHQSLAGRIDIQRL